MTFAADETTDVLVVGAGPTGLMCALLLARLGVRSIVVERNPITDEHPKAHELNARSVEILREVGIDEADLAREASPFEDGSRVLFCRSINEEIGRIDLLADPGRRSTYETHLLQTLPYFNLSQSEFEKLLVAKAREHTLIDMRFGQTWEGCDEEGGGVVSRIGGPGNYRILSRYLLGCDGAASRVRKAIGVEMDGPAEIQTFVNAYFKADLRASVRTPAKLYWIFHPTYSGALIAHHIEKRWVFAVPVYTPWEEPGDLTPSVLRDRIEGALGFAVPGLELASTSTWRMTAQVARSYRLGRVFLVGDAAHRFPPTGGLGMNTGIADAHNLCWKLAAALRGVGGDPLLDSYEVERRPVAQRNCDESRRNFDKMFDVIEAIGLSPDAPQLLARIMGNRLVRFLPAALRNVLQRALTAPAAFLIRRLLKEGPARKRVQAAIAEQAGHFDRLGLDIGYCYGQGAIDAGDRPPTPISAGVSEYVPSWSPGARLPHVWITLRGERRSTHDLIGYDKFTLIAGSSNVRFTESARAAAMGEGIALEVVAVDNFEWTGAGGIPPDGAVLVRPDGHIAWTAREAGALDAGRFESALRRILAAPNTNVTTRQAAGTLGEVQ